MDILYTFIYNIHDQGEPGDDFYIIVDGSATVTQFRAEGEESQEVRQGFLHFLSKEGFLIIFSTARCSSIPNNLRGITHSPITHSTFCSKAVLPLALMVFFPFFLTDVSIFLA